MKVFLLSFCRIRTETNGGAWCPKTPISRDSYEYLQIDLGRLTVITMVEIQGRFGNGQVMETPYQCKHFIHQIFNIAVKISTVCRV